MDGKQLRFHFWKSPVYGDYNKNWANKPNKPNKPNKREMSLVEMDKVVPWNAFIDPIDPHYPKTSSKGGRPAYPLATMLRIHLM